MGHGKTVCKKCESIVAQCRCFGHQPQQITYVEDCGKCKSVNESKAKRLIDLIETDITDYIKGIGLEAKSIYWIDNLQGNETSIALVIYNTEDHGQKEFPLNEVLTQAVVTAMAKYIKPETVKQIQAGQIQFQPISNRPIEADRILVISQDGTYQFWGDFVK